MAQSSFDADAHFSEPTVPGYRVLQLDPPRRYQNPRPASGARSQSRRAGRPDSKWTGTVEVSALGSYLVDFVALDLGGTLVLESFRMYYAGPDAPPAVVDETPGLQPPSNPDAPPAAAWESMSDPATLGAGITAVHLRKLSIPNLLLAVKYEALNRGIRSEWPDLDGAKVLDALRSTADLYRPVKKKRSPRIGDDQLRSLAELRLQLDADRHSDPKGEMARQLGYSKDTITDRLNKATAAKWLGEDGRGARRRTPGRRLLDAWAAEARNELHGEEPR